MAADDKLLARRLTRDARVAGKAQARAARVHSSAVARRERVLRRSRRALPVRVAVAGGAVLGAVVTEVGLLWGVAAFAGVRAAMAARHLLQPPDVPPPPAAPAGPAPPPHPRSAAFPAVRRLEQARASLQQLLPLVAPAGRDAAAEAWQAAGEADEALRWQAARLAAVEPHRGADEHLLDQLYAGVVAQERLVVAVADLVTASADPLASGRLQDVTDRLHGLAAGLREVRGAQP